MKFPKNDLTAGGDIVYTARSQFWRNQTVTSGGYLKLLLINGENTPLDYMQSHSG
jgi:hypothetical protein